MNRFFASALAFVTASAVLCSSAVGQTFTWSGAANNGSMNDPSNWVGGIVPGSAASNLGLVFAGGQNFANQDIPSNPFVVQDIQFNGFFQLAGTPLQMDNLGANPTITVNNNGASIQNAISFVDPTTISVTNGSLTFFNAASGNGLTFNGTGFTQVSFNGAGTSLGGTTTINAGASVVLQASAALTGTANVAGGALTLSNPGVLAAGADVNISAGGALVLNSGVNTVDDLDISGGGSVNLGDSLTVSGQLSSSSGANTILNSGGMLALGGPTTINVTSGGADFLAIHAQISTGSFTKTGNGRLTLGSFNPNTFTGTNTISAGTVRGSADQIGTVVDNSVLELTGGSLNSSVISGSGNVVIVGPVDYNAAQAYAGTTTVNGGFLFGDTGTIPALVTGVGSGGGVEFQDAGNFTVASTLAGALFVSKSGAGVMTIGGNNPYTFGTSIGNGGLAITSDTAIGTGSLAIFTPTSTLEAIGSRTLANQLFVGNGGTVQGAGDFNFTDATAKQLMGALNHNSTGTTSIAGKFDVTGIGSLVVNAGALALGDAAIVNGFTSAGPVTVNGGTLSLNSLNFINLPTVTLAGGTLNVPNGYAIPLGAVLQGNGGVTGRLATANGSTIIASGNLTLGDAAHPAGVNLDGELYTNNNTVTLQDSNQAVLGSITDVGTATLDGTLVAPNGAVLNFGRNIIGRGQIQSNNTLADAVIVNGDVNGDAISTPLVFTGYVKGVGTFNNVAFSGTFAPGLSPTLLTVGNTVLLPSNVLQMEIGGLNRGSQHDAFDVLPASTMVLDGNMQVSLINAFNPSLGDQFNLFDGTTSGVFSSFSFPSLNPGLTWDTSLLYTSGILQVVAIPEPATLSMALLVGVALLKRRRS